MTLWPNRAILNISTLSLPKRSSASRWRAGHLESATAVSIVGTRILSSLVTPNYINDTHILRSTTNAPPASTWWSSTFVVYLHQPFDQANHTFRVNTSLHSRSTSSPQHGGLYRRQSGFICDIRSWYFVSNAYAFTC